MKGKFDQKSSVFTPGFNLPRPVTVIEGDSPLIFSGPHNGIAVLDNPEKPLGTDRQWFETAHEARDLNISALFEKMIPRFPAASFVWSNYSRLVADVNRLPEMAIAQTSSEWENQPIPGNSPDILTPEERERRMSCVYWPYHNALQEIVNRTQEKFGYAQLIDMHSFTPVWMGNVRQSEIGMLTLNEDNPLSKATCEFLSEHSNMKYVKRQPYYLPERKWISAASMIRERIGQPYIGFEIRNNMIADEEGRERLCKLMTRYVDYTGKHPEQEHFYQSDMDSPNNGHDSDMQETAPSEEAPHPS